MAHQLIALGCMFMLAACGSAVTKTASNNISANYWDNSYYSVLTANNVANVSNVKPIKLQ